MTDIINRIIRFSVPYRHGVQYYYYYFTIAAMTLLLYWAPCPPATQPYKVLNNRPVRREHRVKHPINIPMFGKPA